MLMIPIPSIVRTVDVPAVQVKKKRKRRRGGSKERSADQPKDRGISVAAARLIRRYLHVLTPKEKAYAIQFLLAEAREAQARPTTKAESGVNPC